MSAAPRQNPPDRRHSTTAPCPVCGGSDDARRGQGERCHGFISGDFVHCTREEHAGQAPYHPGSQTWSHKLNGPCPCGHEHRPAIAKPGAKVPFVVAKRFEYRAADGSLLFQVEKSRDKRFRQRRPDPTSRDGWTYSLKGVVPVPYRLPELLAAEPARLVFVAEGEKDCDRLELAGQVATTNPMGAGKWRDCYSPHFEGRDVVILPDNDQVGRDHARQVARSLHGIARSVKVVELPGLPEKGDVSDWLNTHTMAELKAIASEAEALGQAAAEELPVIPIRPDERPIIVCGSQKIDEGLKTWTPLALTALANTNRDSPYLFQRGGKLSRIRHMDEDAPPTVELVCLDALRGLLDRSAYYANEVMTKSGPKLRFGPPRIEIPKDIMALGDLDSSQFPHLDGVIETPRFSVDGDLIIKPGYHPGARTYYAPSPGLSGLDIPDRPTDDQVAEARALLVEDLLVDFSFANQASRANAVACMLLPFARLMIAGPTPNHHFTASTEGTGKGLCAAACAFPFLGREPDLNPQKESEAEWRKALTSFFISGGSHYFIDNMYNAPGWDDVPQDVGSGTLALAWTAPFWRDRLLGGNDEARIKILSVFMSSGNNVAFTRELHRRLALIELVALEEVPSLRTGFKHDPLMVWAAANRLPLARACLILCRRWIVEGRPEGDQIMGSYESYARVMGGILGACGIDGFLANRPKAVKRNPEATRWGALVCEWNRQKGSRPVTTAELCQLIGDDVDLGEMFAEVLGDGGEASKKIRLGKALEKYQGRIWTDWRIGRSLARAANKGILWKLLPKEEIPDENEEGYEDRTDTPY